jgi:hypothetical protein
MGHFGFIKQDLSIYYWYLWGVFARMKLINAVVFIVCNGGVFMVCLEEDATMQKRRYGQIIVGLVVLLALILACSVPGSDSGGGADQTLTAGVQTFIAQMTQKAMGSASPLRSATPTSTATQTETPTVPAVATATQTFTETPTVTLTPQPCNRAQFVADITVPDDTAFYPGSGFIKTWRFKNVGTCNWTSGYQVVYASGDQMSAPAAVNLTAGTIYPNGTVDASVSMVAPGSLGTYQGYFKLKAADGTIFGIGGSGADSFWVKIRVVPVPPPPTFTPTPTLKVLKPLLKITLLPLKPVIPFP